MEEGGRLHSLVPLLPGTKYPVLVRTGGWFGPKPAGQFDEEGTPFSLIRSESLLL
jgi:hypothetical protein